MTQVLLNPFFTQWPHGSPVSGSFGAGNETAAKWVCKWGKSHNSQGVASKIASGLRYSLRPDPAKNWATFDGEYHDGPNGGETFYLRQYKDNPTPGKYQATIRVLAHSAGVRGGFYIYQGDHAHNLNQVGSLSLPSSIWKTFAVLYTLPSGSSDDLLVAFLFTTKGAVPALVDVHSFTLTRR